MKQTRSIFRMLSLALVMALLVGGILVPAEAAVALKKQACRGFTGLQAGWFYVPSTLPDTVGLTEWYDWLFFVHEGKPEFATKCTIEFVSGDEELKDALQTRDYYINLTNSSDEEKEEEEKDAEEAAAEAAAAAANQVLVTELYVDNSVLEEPGDAVFHVKVESEHYTDEQDVALHVLSWDEEPLVLTKNGENEITLMPMEAIENIKLATLSADIREDEIIADFAEQGIEIASDKWMNPVVQAPQDTMVVVPWSNQAENQEDYREGLQALGYGTVVVNMHYGKGNIAYVTQIRINVPDYRITGPKIVRPGEAAQYAIMDDKQDANRTFEMSIEGEGVTLDKEKLTVTAAEDAEAGAVFTLTATASDGADPVTFSGKVGTGIIAQEDFETIDYREGFTIPLLSNNDIYKKMIDQERGRIISQTKDVSGASVTAMMYNLIGMADFAEEDDAVAEEAYGQVINMEGMDIQTDEIIKIDGHPARILTADTGTYSLGLLMYMRNNRMLIAEVDSFPTSEEAAKTLPTVTEADLKAIAEQISYDPTKAAITTADGAITVTAKDEATVMSGGKKLQLTAMFANPEKVNAGNRNNKVEWTVTDTATGEAPADVTIDAKGVLSADKALSEVRKVEVTASSPVFHTSAKYAVTVLPAVKSFKTEPKELFFYTGTEAQTLTAVLEPETVPTDGITWTINKEGIVEITDNKDGTATIKPLAAGRTTMTATEPGGKKADLRVTVQEPVKELKLEAKEKSTPGGKVKVKATVSPKEAGNKKLEWSLDVGKDIATIKNGEVRINKKAPSGTVITVTCTAAGAPEPVTSSIQIEVE